MFFLRKYSIPLQNLSQPEKKYDVIDIDSKKDNIVYFFPPYIAHGYIALSTENHMLYATSGVYNPKEEYKINLKNDVIPDFFNQLKKI